MAIKNADYKDARGGEEHHVGPSPERSPSNPQAARSTDPQRIRETVNDAGVVPGGWHPREPIDRLPRHANDKEFGMPDLTTSGAR